MFLPTTLEEADSLGWKTLDIILITGDAYIDSPFMGVSVIGKVLVDAGYRVGLIAQPDTQDATDIRRLGEPELFWGVSSGAMDSMIANYTATQKRRKSDDLTAGGKNDRRPDRAVIAYANLIRKYFKNTRPIVLGGVEASLRRISHYDYWSDKVRRSVLFDARADVLVYGMGEKAVLELAKRLREKQPVQGIRGTCTISSDIPEGYLELPSHEDVAEDIRKFEAMFRISYENNDPISARGLVQKQDTRYVVHHPPAQPLEPEELDRIHELDYEREAHPFEKARGVVRALDTIRFSLVTHRGCYGGCHFCAISMHQGLEVVSRSMASIVREAVAFKKHPKFKGIISDVGGPTANMYGFECRRKKRSGACRDRNCMTPDICQKLLVSHRPQIDLLKRLRELPHVRKVFIGSGIRHDLVLKDERFGRKYLETVVQHHVSGQLKLAPEHTEGDILKLMAKPDIDGLLQFKEEFDLLSQASGKKQFLTYYFIAAYPGCTEGHMIRLRDFVHRHLKINPEQVQIFTPSPATVATLMYYTERDFETGRSLFVEKERSGKERQKRILVPENGGR